MPSSKPLGCICELVAASVPDRHEVGNVAGEVEHDVWLITSDMTEVRAPADHNVQE
jgi:hypothetical protein